ncbi:MAG: LptF/LptG family permease [Chromatiales bacterium]|nr:LptF/LptG family permease [Chromatiales bacterium]
MILVVLFLRRIAVYSWLPGAGMKVYRRYLAREIVRRDGAGAVRLPRAVRVFRSASPNWTTWARAATSCGTPLLFVALTLPGRVYELFPIAVLIGTLYALDEPVAALRDHGAAHLGLSPRAPAVVPWR